MLALLLSLPTLLACVYCMLLLTLNSPWGQQQVLRVASRALAGGIEASRLQVGPWLNRLDLWDARFLDEDGRPVVEVAQVGCGVSLQRVLERHLELVGCRGRDGRVLVLEDVDGYFTISKAPAGAWRSKPRVRRPLRVVFRDARIDRVDVVVQTSDMMVVLRDTSAWGDIDTGPPMAVMDLHADIGSGRLLMSERMFGLGPGKHSEAQARWEVLRRTRPWEAAEAPVPAQAGRGPGPLALEFGRTLLEDARWRRDDLHLGRLLARGPDLSVDASGTLRFVPERPKLPRRERGVLYYDGFATLALPPDSHLFAWFLPGVLEPMEGATLAPMTFQGFGTVRFYDGGGTRVQAESIRIAGWPVDRLDLGLSIHEGRAALAPDSQVELLGGRITGSGWMVPAHGLWGLDLCVDQVGVEGLLLPLGLTTTGGLFARARLTSEPAECQPGTPGALRLGGDLTLKAFERMPAATTLPGRPIQPPMLQGSVGPLWIRWPQEPAGLPVRALQVDAEFTLSQRGTVRLGSNGRPGVRVRAGEDTFSLSGTVRMPQDMDLALRMSLATRRAAAWTDGLGMAGLPDGLQLRADWLLEGPAAAPVVRNLDVRARLPQAEGLWPALEAEARMRTTPTQLVIDRAAFTSPLGTVSLEGQLGLFAGSLWSLRSQVPMALALDIPRWRVGRMVPALGSTAVLVARGVTVGGRLDEPTVALEEAILTGAVLGGEPFSRMEARDVILTGARVEVPSLVVDKAAGTLEGALHWDVPGRAMQASLQTRGLDLQDFAMFDATGLEFRGPADVSISVAGDPGDPASLRVNGGVVLRRVEVNRYPVGDLTLACDSAAGTVDCFGAAGGDFRLWLQVPLDGAPLQLETTFRDLQLQDWWGAASSIASRSAVDGTLRVGVDWSGSGATTADLTLDRLEVALGQDLLRLQRPLVARWATGAAGGEPGMIRLEPTEVAVGERTFQVEGRLHLADEGPRIALTGYGALDFSMLRLLPELVVDAQGPATFRIKADGPLDDPRVTGMVDHGAVSIAPRGLGAAVNLQPGRFEILADGIVFPENAPLRGTVFGGDLVAWGRVGLESLLPASVDMRATFNNLTYRVPEVMVITLSGDVRFEALALVDLDTWTLSGNVELLDGRFIQNFDILSDYFAFGDFGRNVQAFSLPVWRTNEVLRRLRTRLSIVGRDRFFVDTRVANAILFLEMRTDLEVSGRLGAMNVQGEMEALPGSRINYRGRRFDTRRMFLRFAGDLDPFGYPMPRLEAEIESSIRPCVRRQQDTFDAADTAGRALDGTPASVLITAFMDGLLPYDINFRLESTPFYDQRDQLSLILTGCTVDELTAASAAGAPTLDVVLRPVIDMVARSVEERLNFDDVDVIPAAGGSAGILIQDEINRRFMWTLDATVGAGDDNRQIIRGAYKLFEWLIIEVQEQTSRTENIRVDAGVRFRVVFD